MKHWYWTLCTFVCLLAGSFIHTLIDLSASCASLALLAFAFTSSLTTTLPLILAGSRAAPSTSQSTPSTPPVCHPLRSASSHFPSHAISLLNPDHQNKKKKPSLHTTTKNHQAVKQQPPRTPDETPVSTSLPPSHSFLTPPSPRTRKHGRQRELALRAVARPATRVSYLGRRAAVARTVRAVEGRGISCNATRGGGDTARRRVMPAGRDAVRRATLVE